MKPYQARRTPFPWTKKGLLFQPGREGFSHGSHPCAVHIRDDLYVVAFTRRDERQRSHIFLSYATVSDAENVLHDEP